MSHPRDRRPPQSPGRFTLVGAGAVASAIGGALVAQGWRPVGILGRTETSPRAAALAKRLGGESQVPWDGASAASELVIVAVPDDQLCNTAEELAGTEVDWRGKTVLHTSGVHDADALDPLRTLGASVAAVHPLQSFAPNADTDRLTGVYVTTQGDDAAQSLAGVVFGSAGSVVIPLSAADKVAVHAAASVLSNFTVTLAAMAREILQTTTLGERQIVSMLQPLLRGTVDNIAEKGPERALTGPIVRGDSATVARHVKHLGDHAPHLVTAYVALATETVRVARKTSRLSAADAMIMLDTVVEALPVPPASDDE